MINFFKTHKKKDLITSVYVVGSLIGDELFDDLSDIDLVVITKEESDLNFELRSEIFEHTGRSADILVISEERFLQFFLPAMPKFCVLIQLSLKNQLIYGEEFQRPVFLEEFPGFRLCLLKKLTSYFNLLKNNHDRHTQIPFIDGLFDHIQINQKEHFLVIKTLINYFMTLSGLELLRLDPLFTPVGGKYSLLRCFIEHPNARDSEYHQHIQIVHHQLINHGRIIPLKSASQIKLWDPMGEALNKSHKLYLSCDL